MGVTFWAWPNVAFHFHMAHPVVNVTEEQAAAAIEGLDHDKVPNVIVFLLRPSDEAGPAGEAKPAIQGTTLFWPMADLTRD